MNFDQIQEDFSIFPKIETKLNNQRVKERFCQNPGAVSICRYRIKDNQVYRSCEGIHVGFKMFSDELLLTLARMVKLPDVEFWMNLGDWPQQKYSQNPKTPAAVISWCGHEDFTDIVVPTYDVAENTMGMMYKVAQDQFKLQDEARKVPWEAKTNKLFFRGRDSNQQRLGRFYSRAFFSKIEVLIFWCLIMMPIIQACYCIKVITLNKGRQMIMVVCSENTDCLRGF